MTNIEQLASLARIELTKEETESFDGQIASVLDYVKKIQELDLPADAPMMAHSSEAMNVWREDIAEACDPTSVVAAFPETIGGMNAVPAVFDREE